MNNAIVVVNCMTEDYITHTSSVPIDLDDEIEIGIINPDEYTGITYNEFLIVLCNTIKNYPGVLNWSNNTVRRDIINAIHLIVKDKLTEINRNIKDLIQLTIEMFLPNVDIKLIESVHVYNYTNKTQYL